MNKKNELLSIGELAKITGVNINSLRYYEKVGILPPVYVNHESGYRYYSLAQVNMVIIIQICVELNIPLKDLNKFKEHPPFIDYTSLLDYGEDLVERKIKALQYSLDFIQHAKEEVVRIKEHKGAKDSYIRIIPEKFFYVSPYNPKQGKKAFYTKIGNLFSKLSNKNIEPFYEYGVLYEYLPNETKQYIFTEIMPTTSKDENIKVIPCGNYMCSFVQDNQIEKAPELFPELFKEKEYILAIITETSFDIHQEDNPIIELRICLD